MSHEATVGRRGEPRSPEDASALARFDQRMALPLVLAALLPLVIVADQGSSWVTVVVNVAAWLVFLSDLVFHERRLVHYLRTWLGRFDLFVVVVTAPWFLVLPTESKFVMLIRLARIARVVMATRGARRLFDRLGRVALVAVAVVILGAFVAYRAERDTNPEFASYGDSLWWATVTITTVGYGDIVPETPTGRVVGVMIMVTGIAVLGVLAGSLASFFRLDTGPGAPDGRAPPEPAPHDALAREVDALRRQVTRLTDAVSAITRARDGPVTPEDREA